jgi:hypothetical protein
LRAGAVMPSVGGRRGGPPPDIPRTRQERSAMTRSEATAILAVSVVFSLHGVYGCGPPEPAREGDTTAFLGATLFDGTGSPPVEDAVVVVRAGRIAAVGVAISGGCSSPRGSSTHTATWAARSGSNPVTTRARTCCVSSGYTPGTE